MTPAEVILELLNDSDGAKGVNKSYVLEQYTQLVNPNQNEEGCRKLLPLKIVYILCFTGLLGAGNAQY
jgi:hypothetical protein